MMDLSQCVGKFDGTETSARSVPSVVMDPTTPFQLFELALEAVKSQPFGTLIARVNAVEFGGHLFFGWVSFLEIVAFATLELGLPAAEARLYNEIAVFFQVEFDVLNDSMTLAIPDHLSGRRRIEAQKRVQELMAPDSPLIKLFRGAQ